MKWLFIILLLLNVAYLGWEIDKDSQRARANVVSAIPIPAGAPELKLLSEMEQLPNKRELMRLDNQLSAESFNSEPVLPIGMNPNTEQMMEELITDTSNVAMDNPAIENPGASESLTVDKHICYSYGPIPDESDVVLMSEWLKQRSIKFSQRQTNEQGKQLFWIYLAPQENRARAEATLKDLQQKGVRDLRLIRTGDLSNAISLGLFSSQASVNRRLKEIASKGYKAVAVPHAGGELVYWFDVQLVQNSNYINDLFTGVPARFNALPVECNEIAMQLVNP